MNARRNFCEEVLQVFFTTPRWSLFSSPLFLSPLAHNHIITWAAWWKFSLYVELFKRQILFFTLNILRCPHMKHVIDISNCNFSFLVKTFFFLSRFALDKLNPIFDCNIPSWEMLTNDSGRGDARKLFQWVIKKLHFWAFFLGEGEELKLWCNIL